VNNWKYTAEPDSVDFVETLQGDDLQSLHLTDHGTIVLLDQRGALLRRYGAHQRDRALADWRRWRSAN
jgi:hypothetical protein